MLRPLFLTLFTLFTNVVEGEFSEVGGCKLAASEASGTL
jgi:hypothetical protein